MRASRSQVQVVVSWGVVRSVTYQKKPLNEGPLTYVLSFFETFV